MIVIKAVNFLDPDSKVESADILNGRQKDWTSFAGFEVLQTVSNRVMLLVVDEVPAAPKW